MASLLNNLAWVETTYPNPQIRNGQEAIKEATAACEVVHWQMSNYLDTLAAAYAETGDFVSAFAWQRKAMELRASKADKQQVPETILSYPLHRYESGRPIRESSTTRDARMLLANGKFKDAEQLLVAHLSSNKRYLGDSHAETLGCILALIELYEVWNRPEEAQKYRVLLPEDVVNSKLVSRTAKKNSAVSCGEYLKVDANCPGGFAVSHYFFRRLRELSRTLNSR